MPTNQILAEVFCHSCTKKLPKNNQIKCDLCKHNFHVKCCQIRSLKEFKKFKENDTDWFCNTCTDEIFPFSSLNDEEFCNIFNIFTNQANIPNKKSKCGLCRNRFKTNNPFALCNCCSSFYHLKCASLTKNSFPLPSDWKCCKCSIQTLPFSSINNDDFLLTSHGLDSTSIDYLKDVPSFSIQTLLDQFPGEKFAKDDFLSSTIESKYYTPAQFINEKFSKRKFTMIHLNIASLQRHIDELRSFLTLLNHPFDIIAITETRLHAQATLVDVNIDGYDFIHKETSTQNGGVALFIKSCHEFEPLNHFSVSLENICETVFVEVKDKSKKKIVIGCIYRHHTPISDFSSEFLEKTLQKITKSKKTCVLLGDFNIDLIKYDSNQGVSNFYDNISSHGFRPLILQPSRVTATSATLIDNIFINDLSCISKGGNITSSISDHFLQLSQIDLFNKEFTFDKNKKSLRNWRIFNKREFDDELGNIRWENIIKPESNTEVSCSLFLTKTTKLLDEMAPFRKLTRKEIELQQKPWITQGILKSMNKRDSIYKEFAIETDDAKKLQLGKLYTEYRNKIVFFYVKLKKILL